MFEGVDFELRAVSELRKQGGTSISKHYILTPDSFKICLMRSRRNPNQTVDPTIYGLYFILLEKAQTDVLAVLDLVSQLRNVPQRVFVFLVLGLSYCIAEKLKSFNTLNPITPS
jgi:hypothetical protein